MECAITVVVTNLQREFMRAFCIFRIAVRNASRKIKCEHEGVMHIQDYS